MGTTPKRLIPYVDAVTEAVEAHRHGVWDSKAHMTGGGLVSIKVETRGPVTPTANTREFCPDSSEDAGLRAFVMNHLTAAGYTVTGVRSSWFDWGRGGMGAKAVTFYVKPMTG